jgi:glycosyltransferase involved in cell wall biosynthesis
MEKNIPADYPAKISVILPVYNQAQYVSAAIQSVLGQTYPDFELIVVDDGSTDETPQILAGFHDPRMRVIRQPNAGLSAARNSGIKLSSAPLITFLDSDDYFLTNKLEVLSQYLGSHPEIGLVAGRAKYIDHAGNYIHTPDTPLTPLELPQLLYQNPICVSGILLRRSWLDNYGLFDETLRACEDFDLWLRLLAAGCQMAWDEHFVVAYRIHAGQMTGQSARMRKAMFAMLDKFFAQPELPEYLSAHKESAYATAYAHAAVYAYNSDELDGGALDLAEAIRLHPIFAYDDYQKLVELLVGWAHDPRSTDPAIFLQRVMTNPPLGHPGLVKRLRQEYADALLEPLFQGPREIWQARRKDLLKAVIYKPGWLLNRGVLRMLAAAWLGI